MDTDPARQRLPELEARLRAQVERQALEVYGVQIRQVGIDRFSLPEATLAATVARMRAERETVAAARTAEGLRAAAELRTDAAPFNMLIQGPPGAAPSIPDGQAVGDAR